MNLTKFDFLVNKIRKEVEIWCVINVMFDAAAKPDAAFALQQLHTCFGAIDGAIFQMKNDEFVILVRLGREPDLDVVKTDVARKFPDHKCSVEINDLTKNGLQAINIRMRAAHAARGASTAGKDPAVKKFFVVDDDLFIRKTMNRLLSAEGLVVEFADSAEIVENYKKGRPDIVFVDLHLPDSSGIDVMNRLLAEDARANIVIISADSTADNVLQAQAKGSKGFLGKPLCKEKVHQIVKSLTG
ncbi:MAG: response regulator [Alphaproteobacteria bacterium]|nr:response regulator [Alphaproteobacteria bacterium]MDE2336738.1 response regulator [Alphaproteobacteria bacterium]